MSDTPDKTQDFLDHQRWLLNNGIVNDLAKDNLYVYGSIVHKDIEAVYVAIDVEKKLAAYTLYFSKKMFKKVEKFNELSTADTIIGMWKFRRMLKKSGNMNFQGLLSRFVKDYCGPSWSVTVVVKETSQYEEGFEESGEQGSTTDSPANKPTDG